MDRNQIEQRVLTVLSAILQHQLSVADDVTRQNTAEWDSLKHVQIMFALEEELGIEFSEEELVKLDSMAKIIRAAEAKNAA